MSNIHLSTPIWLRALCLTLALSLFYSASAQSVNFIAGAVALNLEQAARAAGQFTDRPVKDTRVFKGGREPDTRGGLWNSKNSWMKSAAKAAQWMDRPEPGLQDLMAATNPALVFDGGDEGGELPGEGEGGGLPPITLNTNTGNKLTTVPIVSWSARGGSGIDFTLYHNSRSNYSFDLPPGWSHSYDIRIDNVGPLQYVVRLGNGLSLPFEWGTRTVKQWNETTSVYDTVTLGTGYVGPSQLPWLQLVTAGQLVDRHDPSNVVTYSFGTGGKLASITDGHGNVVTINRNSGGRITSVTDNTGRSLTFSGSTLIDSVTAPGTKIWTFNRPSGKLDSITYPELNGSYLSRSYTYSSTDDILTETDLRGKVWTYTYDANQWLASVKDPMNKTWTVAWTSTGVTITDPLSHTWSQVYDSGKLMSDTDANGYTETYEYDPHAQVTKVTDRRGKQTKWVREWKALTFVTKKETNALSQVTTFNHNTSGFLTSVTDPLGRTVTANYNSYGDILSAVDPLGRTVFTNAYNSYGELVTTADGLGRSVSVTYNSNGDVTQVSDPAGVNTTATYDVLGRPLTATDGSGSTYSLDYDEWGRPESVTLPGGATSSLTYNGEGGLLTATDPLSRSGSRTYNDRGQVATTTNAKGETQTYSYDNAGRLTGITNGRGYTRTYTYTNRGDVASLTLPDSSQEQWSYNANGDTTAYTNPLGQVIGYVYDDLGRLTTVDYPTGTDTAFSYDSGSRLLSMVDSSGTSAWTYNNADEVTELSTPQGVIQYAYNLAGQRTSMVQVGTGTTAYSYDSAGRLSTTTDPFGDGVTYIYDSAGRLNKRFLANGTYEQFSYDSRSRVTDISTKNSSNAVLRSRAYTFDVASQVSQVVEGGVTTNYSYDLAGQLTSEVKSSGYTGSYTYDANGNRLTRVVNGVTESYSYDSGDKLLSVSGGTDPRTFVYDAAGRTTGIVRGSGTTSFTYDYESRVTQITKPGMTTNSMSYNGLDTRVGLADSSGTKTFKRDGVGVTAPVLSDGTATFNPGVSEKRGSVKTYFSHALKNADAQTDVSQTVTATRQYDAFGNVIASTGVWKSQFGNAGRFGYQEDPDSGLKLLGHRYYDSSTGRFLTRDPAKDGRNWYGYCGNNPVSYFDSDGHKDEDLSGPEREFVQKLINEIAAVDPVTAKRLQELLDAGRIKKRDTLPPTVTGKTELDENGEPVIYISTDLFKNSGGNYPFYWKVLATLVHEAEHTGMLYVNGIGGEGGAPGEYSATVAELRFLKRLLAKKLREGAPVGHINSIKSLIREAEIDLKAEGSRWRKGLRGGLPSTIWYPGPSGPTTVSVPKD